MLLYLNLIRFLDVIINSFLVVKTIILVIHLMMVLTTRNKFIMTSRK